MEAKLAALEAAAAGAPEYAEILPLFAALYDFARGQEGRTGIRVDDAGVVPAERLAAGCPLVTAAELRLEPAELAAFLRGAAAVLREHGRESADLLERFDQALANEGFEPADLVVAVLERRRAPLDEAAERLGLPAPLLEYLLELPLKVALERYADSLPAADFPEWHEAFCPVCGSRPAMAELCGEEGRRRFGCSTCFRTWPFTRLKCPACGNEDTDRLSYFSVGEGPTRVDTCSACSRYIKTRDNRLGGGERPLEIEDLLTIHLDLLAAREGFERGK